MNEDRKLPSRSRGHVPFGLIGMMCMVLFVEQFIAHNETSFRNPWGWDWFLTNRAARKKVKDCDILCFGDSLVKFGVIPRALEQRTGQKAYNLAISAGQAPGSYFLFRSALESGARPKAVILDAMSHLMAQDLAANAKIWPELLSARDCVELSVRDRNPDFFASTMLARFLPSVRDRSEIQAAVLAAFQGDPPPLKRGIGAFCRNWDANRGAQVMPHVADRPPMPVDAFAPALFPEAWHANSLNTHYLREFLRLAEHHNIQVYWLLPPVSPEVQKRREANGRDAEYSAFVDAIRSRHPKLRVLDARRSSYGDDVHIDPIHLDSQGASALSRDLAMILRRDPAGLSPWHVLPHYRQAGADASLEDLNQSIAHEMSRLDRK